MRRHLLSVYLGLSLTCVLPARADFISQVLGDNPVGFWLLDDATSAATDSSGSFDGTYGAGVTPQGISGPSWVPTPGLVADFNGRGNIEFPGNLFLGVNGYTIEAWINPSLASLQAPSRIVTSGLGFGGYGFGTTAGGELMFSSFTVQDYVTGSVNLLPNEWYYVGVVLDGNNDANFYVNGELAESVEGTAGGTTLPLTSFTIGSRSVLRDEFFDGGIAGVSVYNTALSEFQIQAQYSEAVLPGSAIPEPGTILGLGALLTSGLLSRHRRATA